MEAFGKDQADELLEVIGEEADTWDKVNAAVRWTKSQLLLPDICAHKEWLIEVADKGIDVATAFDMPWVSNVVEPLVDRLLGMAAKSFIRWLINRQCPA